MSNGFNVIVLEDEPLVALMIEEMLQEMGCAIAAVALNDKEALAALGDPRIDLAVLDVNLGGTDSLLVAQECQRRGIPIIFATGYSVRDVPVECLDWPIVPKPFSRQQMQRAMDAIRSAQSRAMH